MRPPKQRRSRDSYERALAATHQLLEENGFEGFTVQEVARRSGVSIGAIYERFGNKETLLHAAHARLMASMAAYTDALPPDGDGAAPIGAAVALVARVMDENRKALRAFMHLGAVDEVISARGSEASVAMSKSFKAALAPYVEQFGHPEPGLALDVAFRMTYSTLARQLMYGGVFESEVRLGWKRLVDELTAACTAYLVQGRARRGQVQAGAATAEQLRPAATLDGGRSRS